MKQAAVTELVAFDVATLDEGAIVRQLNAAIEKARKDIEERMEITKDRSILLEVTLSPPDEDDAQQMVGWSFRVQTKLPAGKRTKGTAKLTKDGLRVHVYSDEPNLNQTVLPFSQAKTGE